MAVHTEGRWSLDDEAGHAPSLFTGGYHGIDAGDGCNAPDLGYRGFSIAGYMSIEDARLIASAPDLLAFAEWCVSTRFDSREISIRALAALHLAKHGAAPATTNEEAA